MTRRPGRDALIDAIYEAGFEPARWPGLLQQMLDHLGLASADLYLFKHGQPVFKAIHGGAEDFIEEYLERYHGRTLRTQVLPAIAEGQVYTDLEFTSERDMRRDPYYAEFLRRADACHALAVPLLKGDTDVALLALHKSWRKGPPTQQQIEAFRALVPHLQRAVKTQLQLLDADTGRQLLSECLDHLAHGVVLLDRHGLVHSMNRAAERLLFAHPHLHHRHGTLLLEDRDAARWLKRQMALLATNLPRQPLATSIHALADPEGGTTTLYLAPVSAVTRTLLGIIAVLFILAATPVTRRAAESTLAQRFGLTPAETALAVALLDGRTLHEHAGARQVSLETVRTQLRGLFAKTDQRRQTDLVRVLLDAIHGIEAIEPTLQATGRLQ